MIYSEDRKIYCVSDIHGGYELIEHLLQYVEENSYLFILGDLFEKGLNSLKTLRYVMELSQQENVKVILGNNDDTFLKVLDPKYVKYFRSKIDYPRSIIYDMIQEANLVGDEYQLQAQVKQSYKKEIEWLKSLDLMIETEHFIFVHAGIEKRIDYQNSHQDFMLRLDNFYEIGHASNKIVVCGHYPTAIYRHDRFDNNIIIDLEKKIICIDGGYGATNFGQLNMLEIEVKDDFNFKTYTYDYFPIKRIIKAQASKGNIRGACYPHYELEIIKRDQFFTLTKIKATGEETYVKNEFLIENKGKYYTIDDTPNNLLKVSQGDCVKILRDDTLGYALVKKNGIYGWVNKECIEQ